MLTAYISRLAVPGQLMVGELELAIKYEANDPLSSRYQAKRESIQDLNLKDGLEVINMPVDAIENIQDVVARGFRLDLVTPPAHIVMLQWRSTFYGPFTVTRVVAGAPSESQSFSFTPAQTIGMTIYEVDQTAFAKATKDHRIIVQEKVSLTDNNRRRGYPRSAWPYEHAGWQVLPSRIRAVSTSSFCTKGIRDSRSGDGDLCDLSRRDEPFSSGTLL